METAAIKRIASLAAVNRDGEGLDVMVNILLLLYRICEFFQTFNQKGGKGSVSKYFFPHPGETCVFMYAFSSIELLHRPPCGRADEMNCNRNK